MKSKKILAVLMAAGMTPDPIQERIIRSVSYNS